MSNETQTPEGISNEIVTKIESEVKTLLHGGRIEKIESENQFQNSNALALNVRKIEKDIELFRVNIVKPFNEKVKEINSWFKFKIGPLGNLRKNIANVMIDYEKEQEKKRIEKQRLLDQEAAKKREAMEAQARKQRAKEEAQLREAEKKRKLAEKTKDAAKKLDLENQAASAELKAQIVGNKAEDLKTVAETTVVEQVARAPKTKGRSTRGVWKGVIVNQSAFFKWCIDNDKFRLILPNQSALNTLVGESNGILRISGVRNFEDTITTLRA